MDSVQIGDIITRSDGRKYAIIDDNFPMTDIAPDILQIPMSSTLAKNLIGGHIGDAFNYNNQLIISDISHSDYFETINKKKVTIAKENQIRREEADIKNALDTFDFQLADDLRQQSDASEYNKQRAFAIYNLKKTIYDSTYDRKTSPDLTRIINRAINSGVISNAEVAHIMQRATIERNNYDKQQALIYAKEKEREYLAWKKAKEKEELEKQRKIKETDERERRKRNNYKNIIASRGIKELIHFTNISNLETIIKYGILPRKEVDRRIPTASVNDMNRYDTYTNATCLSVSFPNYKMFYKYQNEDKDARWAVLSLKPELLTNFDVKYFFFYKENAAKNESSRCSFAEMFGSSNGCDPEDPQAEILAFGVIPPKYIQRIYVQTQEDKNNLERRIGRNIDIEVNAKYFKYRSGDYL